MTAYKVITKSVSFNSTYVLDLTEKQYLRRKNIVEEVKGGYRPLSKTEFKQGETVRIVSGDVPKAMLINLENKNKPEKSKEKDDKHSKDKIKKDAPKDQGKSKGAIEAVKDKINDIVGKKK